MGMMNNSYFRVKVHRVVDPESGKPALKFQHPTLAGPGNFGGWFEEQVLGPRDAPKAPAPAPPVTPPAVAVPKGPVLAASRPYPEAAFGKAGAEKALNPRKWVTLPLQSKTVQSHDTRVFRFALPSEKHVLGLPVGQHFFVKATVNGKAVIRAYTPVRDGEGWVDLLIKVYFANVHPRFPAGGLLTQHIDGLAIGDTIEVKGPIGHYSFPPQITGEPLCFNHVDKKKMQTFAKVGLIAGGSGITPVMQVATALLKDPATKVEVHILYANQTPTDILMADELNAFEKDPRAHVWYTVDRPGGNPDHPLNADDWKYSTGFINEQMVRDYLPAPSAETVVFMCGPPMMLEKACIPNLKRVGHEEFNIRVLMILTRTGLTAAGGSVCRRRVP